MDKLRILHIFRAPIGGLFRHVYDLASEQIKLGHEVGIICDSKPGTPQNEDKLNNLAPNLALGLSRIPIERQAPHWRDLSALWHVLQYEQKHQPDIVHGHGAKGGALARFPRTKWGYSKSIRAYTPHGGSLYYKSGSIAHKLYMSIERFLAENTHLFVFESKYAQEGFENEIGKTNALSKTVYNGIAETEFAPVDLEENAADFIFIGEFRWAKGIDTLIDAFCSLIQKKSPAPSLRLIGSGPEEEKIRERIRKEDLGNHILTSPPMPAREAFAKGRFLLAPSWAESLPYLLLEAAAARVPFITTDVGGIHEIMGPQSNLLIPARDPIALTRAMQTILTLPTDELEQRTRNLSNWVSINFQKSSMTAQIISAYTEAMSNPEKET